MLDMTFLLLGASPLPIRRGNRDTVTFSLSPLWRLFYSGSSNSCKGCAMSCDDQSAAQEGVVNCGNCRHRIDMGRKDRIICLAHLDFRQLADGESCSEYESKRESAPEADTEQPCELSRYRGAAA